MKRCEISALAFAGVLWLSMGACSRPSSGDSLPMNWRPTKELNAGLPDGVRVYEGHNLRLPLRAWYVRIREGDAHITTRVVVSSDEDRRETATEFAERLGACVMVNGGYFRMDLIPTKHVGLLQVDSVMIAPPTPSVLREGLRFTIARAALGFAADGRIDVAWAMSRGDTLMEIISPPANRPGLPDTLLDISAARRWPMRDVLSAGPGLVSGGRIHITSDEEVFFGTSIPDVHPRTAAGYTREGHLILLVVDGRQDASRGVDLQELAIIMKDLGCAEALNLDGGGSSTLVVNGRLINRPAGGTIQREVMSALAVFCQQAAP